MKVRRRAFATLGFLAGCGALCALGFLAGCHESWSAYDTTSASHAVRIEQAIENLCGDAGVCKPSQVRALERSAYCDNASMLFEHGHPFKAAAIECPP